MAITSNGRGLAVGTLGSEEGALGRVQIFRTVDGVKLSDAVGSAPVSSLWLQNGIFGSEVFVTLGTTAGLLDHGRLSSLDASPPIYSHEASVSLEFAGEPLVITGVFPSVSGNNAWVVGHDGRATWRNLSTGAIVTEVAGDGPALAADLRGSRLVFGGTDRAFVVDTGSQRLIMTSPLLPDVVESVSISGDGGRIAVGCRNGQIKVLTSPDGIELAQFSSPAKVGAVALSPDGKYLAYGLAEGSVTIVSVADKSVIATPWNGMRAITSMRFSTGFTSSDNGDTLYVGTDGDGVIVIDATWTPIAGL